jgi:transcriptional regulator of acetoin/glycerol metabolism
MRVATARLDHLFGLVGASGCGVLLTDCDGVILDQRCKGSDLTAFREWGLWPGANWSEASEGTNGIGTCLTEKRTVTIHRDEHFFARNTGMSCMDAPVFGADGGIIAALDVSSARVDQTEGFNRLISAMVAQTARSIETDYFRATFPKSRIVVAHTDDSDVGTFGCGCRRSCRRSNTGRTSRIQIGAHGFS